MTNATTEKPKTVLLRLCVNPTNKGWSATLVSQNSFNEVHRTGGASKTKQDAAAAAMRAFDRMVSEWSDERTTYGVFTYCYIKDILAGFQARRNEQLRLQDRREKIEYLTFVLRSLAQQVRALPNWNGTRRAVMALAVEIVRVAKLLRQTRNPNLWS